jgi:hypothetical protein
VTVPPSPYQADSGGFSNPIIGGGGALVYPAIHSPNFSEATMTGWSIDKNGNAFFYGITTSGEFAGTNFVISSAGAFFYSGTPAKGTLVLAITNAAGTDPYGNVYDALFNAGQWSPSTGALLQHFGVDDDGNVYLADATGATRIFMDPAETVIAIGTNPDAGSSALTLAQAAGLINAVQFPAGIALSALPFQVYSGPPAAGNLIAVLAPSSGSDVFGNTWAQEGLAILGTSGQKIIVTIESGVPFLFLSTGAAEENQAAGLQAIITNAGASETMQAFFRGPQGSVHTDLVAVDLGSAAKDGSLTATGALEYVDTSGTVHPWLEWADRDAGRPGHGQQRDAGAVPVHHRPGRGHLPRPRPDHHRAEPGRRAGRVPVRRRRRPGRHAAGDLHRSRARRPGRDRQLRGHHRDRQQCPDRGVRQHQRAGDHLRRHHRGHHGGHVRDLRGLLGGRRHLCHPVARHLHGTVPDRHMTTTERFDVLVTVLGLIATGGFGLGAWLLRTLWNVSAAIQAGKDATRANTEATRALSGKVGELSERVAAVEGSRLRR